MTQYSCNCNVACMHLSWHVTDLLMLLIILLSSPSLTTPSRPITWSRLIFFPNNFARHADSNIRRIAVALSLIRTRKITLQNVRPLNSSLFSRTAWTLPNQALYPWCFIVPNLAALLTGLQCECEYIRDSIRTPVCVGHRLTSCARGDTICPRPLYAGRCGPAAAHPLRLCAQRALLPIAVVSMNINELMNINDVRQSATIFPRPCQLTFDFLILKVVSKSRVTWATCMPILVFLGLSVHELFPMYATNRRQRDRRQTKASLNAPAY